MAYTILKPELTKKIQGVLFDMDGVLLDTERLYVENWLIAAKEAGFPMTFTETLGLRSLNLEERQLYLESLKGKAIKDEPIRLRMDELTFAYINKYGAKPKLGALELLNYLELNNLPRAIASSSKKERIIANLKPLKLDTHFQALCSAREVKNGKPQPDIYLFAAKSLGLEANNCLALEDSEAGIESAFKAKALPIVIPDLDLPSEKTLSLAYAKCDSLLDVIDLIKYLNGDK